MLASLADAPLDDPDLVYEPKYDGIRAIAEVAPRRPVRLWSRLGNEKTRQFPEIAAALADVGADAKAAGRSSTARSSRSTPKGEPTGFQQLQGRIHLARREPVRPARPAHRARPAGQPPYRRASSPSICCATAHRSARPAAARAARGARAPLRAEPRSPLLRISEHGPRRRPRAVQARARARLGRADREARRLAVQVGQAHARLAQAEDRPGTGVRRRRLDRAAPDPRYFGALLLGVYEPSRARSGLRRPHRHRVQRARARAGDEAAEAARDAGVPVHATAEDERTAALGASRELVAQIKFTEWTADAKLRHPVYLGLRDDKKPRDVVREARPGAVHRSTSRRASRRSGDRATNANPTPNAGTTSSRTATSSINCTALENARRDGVLELPGRRAARRSPTSTRSSGRSRS